MSESWTRLAVRLWPFVALVVLAVVFVLMLVFSRKAPIIASLDPAMAAPGQQVVISGDYFGRTEREGSLSLAGEIPPPSLIKSWTDQKIVFVVPEDASSGLVTVSNSQGTSTGVLFTNTRTIPTVLQPASAPGVPLLVAVSPSQPVPGLPVTLTGRGFGWGEQRSQVRLTLEADGPVLNLQPADTLSWSDRTIVLRWPAGVGPATLLQVVTPRGTTPSVAVGSPGPVVFEDPRTLTVEVSATVPVKAGAPLVLWGPVPQGSTGTAWSLVSSQPVPSGDAQPLVFRWPGGIAGDRKLVYQLTLTTWSRRWDGFPAGQVVSGEPPKPDESALAWVRPGATGLKSLTSKWNLDVSDPWLRVQRIQTGLTNAFRHTPVPVLPGGSGRTAVQAVASGTLDSWESSALAVFLANQAGVPGRLVSGLWLTSDDSVVPRIWAEVWFAGAGWVPWDVLDGAPGSLDNRHFAFESTRAVVDRLEPGAELLGPPAGLALATPAGEVGRGGQESIVRWEIRRSGK